jgi:sugar lactone lactonase YvrE
VRSNDPLVARREIDRAARAWPTQPAYLWARALLAARAGDTVSALAALSDYADLSLGRDLRANAELRALASLPAFAAIESRHAVNRRPAPHSRTVVTIADSLVWPEGMDYDRRTGTYYVASIHHGTVIAVSPSHGARALWSQDTLNVGAVLAVRVDTANDALWVTTSAMPGPAGRTPADSTIASLLHVRLADGVIDKRWELPAGSGGSVLGDIALGPQGDVFFSDSNHQVVYWLKAGAHTLDSIVSPLFHSAQGLAPTPDARALYVADYSHGLIRVDLRSGRIERVRDAPQSTSLGLDGIVWYKGSIVAIQNGVAPARVVRLFLSSSGREIERASVIDQNPLADEPTIGTIVGDAFVYVANSQWEKRDGGGGARLPLTAPRLLRLPLR